MAMYSAFIVGRAPVCVTASEASRRLPLAFRASQNILRLEKQSDFIGHLYFVDPYCAMPVLATSGNRYTLRSAQMLY